MNLKTFKEWLDGNGVTFLDNMCFQGSKPGTFTIETVEGDDIAGRLFDTLIMVSTNN